MSNLRANFFDTDGTDFVEISIVGDPNTIIHKVQNTHKEQFAADWKAYKGKGNKPAEVKGTPLTDVKGIGDAMARKLKANGIRTAEELAETPDISLGKAVGTGAYSYRKEAQNLLKQRKDDALERIVAA